MNSVVIRNPITGQLVAGFNSEHQIVQVTTDVHHAKRFTSVASADRFMKRYSGGGHGFDRSKWRTEYASRNGEWRACMVVGCQSVAECYDREEGIYEPYCTEHKQ